LKIAVFYHCLFTMNEEILPTAMSVVAEQMEMMQDCGLTNAADEIHIGINGGANDYLYAMSILPAKANMVFHGIQCKNECRTILMVEEFVKTHPGWVVLYFHAKGATHSPMNSNYHAWRYCMMHHLITEWACCVSELHHGFESCGCHWIPNALPGQNIWGGNFWWATSDFLRTVPSIMSCSRIRTGQSQLDDLETRYEAEVWIGKGKRLPVVRDYHPRWDIGSMCGHEGYLR
jgi:hypothetical protein